MKQILFNTKGRRSAVLLCGLTAMLLFFFWWFGGFSVRAEQIESSSYATSSRPCPECGEPLTVVREQDTTCTTPGYIEYNCDECNRYHEMVHKDTELAPHKWTKISSVAATCTKPAYVTNKCKECNTTVTEEVKDSTLGHNYSEEVIAPTCNSIGYTLHTCTRCKDSYHTDQVGMSDHTYQQTVISEPTCHSVGYLRNICTVCGKYTTEEVAKVEHNWKTEPVAATHTTQGYTVYSCQYPGCGTVVRQDFKETLPYDMVWEDLSTPTCVSGGVKVGHCSDGCGHTETVVLPHLGHAFGEWKTVYSATEKNDGLERRICSRCKHTETQTLRYDPQDVIEVSEPIDPLMLGVIGFLLLVGIAIVVLCFLLMMEHARREKYERKRRSVAQNE